MDVAKDVSRVVTLYLNRWNIFKENKPYLVVLKIEISITNRIKNRFLSKYFEFCVHFFKEIERLFSCS